MGHVAVNLAELDGGSTQPAGARPGRRRVGTRPDRSAGAPLRTVIADDNDAIRALLAAILLPEPDFELVAEARDGAEALEFAEQEGVDLLVLDLSLPELDGLEVLQQLRKSRPDVRAVVYSGVRHAGVEERARALGALDFIVKGVGPDELIDRLRAAAAR